MIDPQTQANKFIKNMGKDHPEGLEVLKTSDPNMMRAIELAIQFGKWVLLQNVGKSLDPSLDPILLQQVIKQGSSYGIIIGDKNIPYNDKFKFYMTTTMPNPHYSPETQVKVTIINFAITPSGLEEQMLATIVGLENPNIEQKKTELVRKNAADRKELLNIEDAILESLSNVLPYLIYLIVYISFDSPKEGSRSYCWTSPLSTSCRLLRKWPLRSTRGSETPRPPRSKSTRRESPIDQWLSEPPSFSSVSSTCRSSTRCTSTLYSGSPTSS